jgi:hypothetical protein
MTVTDKIKNGVFSKSNVQETLTKFKLALNNEKDKLKKVSDGFDRGVIYEKIGYFEEQIKTGEFILKRFKELGL